jgi:hypothetical protein
MTKSFSLALAGKLPCLVRGPASGDRSGGVSHFMARLRQTRRSFYPSCAENPAVQGGDVERGERSSPKLNSVSAAARCTGG